MKIRRFVLALCCLLPGLACAASLPEASQLFRQGQYAQALDRVNGYLSGNAKDPQGRFLKGLILAELNRPQEAIKTFTELSDDYPELPEPYNNLAVLYASQGQYERAKISLEKAIRTHPSYATAHENLGDIYAKMASLAYDKALQLDKGNASAQMKLSLVKDIFTPPAVDKPKTAVKPGTIKTATLSTETASGRVPPPDAAAAKPSDTTKTAVAKPADSGKSAPAAATTPEATIQAWADAWGRRDAAAYLTFYSTAFAPAGGLSRAEWEAQRTQRITRPDYIKVEISDLALVSRGKQVTAKFKQRYESNLLTSTTRKTLTLEKQGGAWKIVSER
jgi:tetratricopeptide (TPR) repeat protein